MSRIMDLKINWYFLKFLIANDKSLSISTFSSIILRQCSVYRYLRWTRLLETKLLSTITFLPSHIVLQPIKYLSMCFNEIDNGLYVLEFEPTLEKHLLTLSFDIKSVYFYHLWCTLPLSLSLSLSLSLCVCVCVCVCVLWVQQLIYKEY